MTDINNNINDDALDQVVGGNDGHTDFSVIDIEPEWVRVTATELNCRYWPNGDIAKKYEFGHRLKVDGITTDGLWYRLWIYNPQGGECNGYIYKQYTEKC